MKVQTRKKVPSDFGKIEFGIDWLNVTIPFYDVQKFFKMLEDICSELAWNKFVEANTGIYNYSMQYRLRGRSFFIVAYNPSLDWGNIIATSEGFNPGLFCSISGDGLRYLNSLNYDTHTVLESVLHLFHSLNAKCSRLDLNIDFFEPDSYPLIKEVQDAFHYSLSPRGKKPEIVSGLNRNTKNYIMYHYWDSYNKYWYYNCQLGHHGSAGGMFRMYNKYCEVTEGRLANVSDEIIGKKCGDTHYWWRMEYELHKVKADAVFQCMNEENSLQAIIYTVVSSFFSVADRLFTSHNDRQDNVLWLSFLNYIGCNINFVQFAPNVPYVQHVDAEKRIKFFKHMASFLYSYKLSCDTFPGLEEYLMNYARDKTADNYRFEDFSDSLESLSFRYNSNEILDILSA